MADSLRVFIAGGSAADRADLAARLSRDGRWIVVGDPDRADLVVMNPEDWARLERRSAPRVTEPRDQPVEGLTPREHEVLALVADGLHNREIAARLGVSEHTVKFHLGAVFGKLGASTRTEAVQRGLRIGLIDI